MQFRFVMFNGRRTKLNETTEEFGSIEKAQERAREITKEVPDVKSVSLWYGLHLLSNHSPKKETIFEAQIKRLKKEEFEQAAEEALEAISLE